MDCREGQKTARINRLSTNVGISEYRLWVNGTNERVGSVSVHSDWTCRQLHKRLNWSSITCPIAVTIFNNQPSKGSDDNLLISTRTRKGGGCRSLTERLSRDSTTACSLESGYCTTAYDSLSLQLTVDVYQLWIKDLSDQDVDPGRGGNFNWLYLMCTNCEL